MRLLAWWRRLWRPRLMARGPVHWDGERTQAELLREHARKVNAELQRELLRKLKQRPR